MLQTTQTNHHQSSIDNPTTEGRLFRHSKRYQWGIAALVWERGGKRGYQFSDGKLRVFKQGYYGLFESAVAPGDGSATTVRRLARLARTEEFSEATRLPTLRDQIEMFRRDYPGGFHGETWVKAKRGEGARKRLKRHREPALAEARAKLSVEAMREAIAGGAWRGLLDTLIEVVGSTDLVPRAQLKKLEAAEPSKTLALALFSWLHNPGGEDTDLSADRRFNRLVRELGPAGSWTLVTSLGALVHPAEHTCVRVRSHTLQGKMLLAEFKVSKRPQGRDYRRFCHVTQAVHKDLVAAGFVPRDMLDVYDFMWETLRPAARDTLLAIPMILETEAREAAAAKPEVSETAGAKPEVSETEGAKPEAREAELESAA